MASELWEKLTARCVDQHRHIERTLEHLLEIQGTMEELSSTLTQAEGVRATWEPIGDLFIDSLPDHIQAIKVCNVGLLPGLQPLLHHPKSFHSADSPSAETCWSGPQLTLF